MLVVQKKQLKRATQFVKDKYKLICSKMGFLAIFTEITNEHIALCTSCTSNLICLLKATYLLAIGQHNLGIGTTFTLNLVSFQGIIFPIVKPNIIQE